METKKMWVKFNQTAFSSEREYFLYHLPTKEIPWHVVFWPEKGNGKPTIIGKSLVNLSQKHAIAWADEVIKNHKGEV
jgi:hypothetical protein